MTDENVKEMIHEEDKIEDVKDKVKKDLKDKIKEDVKDKIEDDLEGGIDDSVEEDFDDKIEEDLDSKIEDVDGKVEEDLDDKVENVDYKVEEDANDKVEEDANNKIEEDAYNKVEENADNKVKEDVNDKVEKEADDKVKKDVDNIAEEDSNDRVEDDANDKVKEDSNDSVEEDAYDKVKEDVDNKVEEDSNDRIEEDVDDSAEEDADDTDEEDADDMVEDDMDDMFEDYMDNMIRENADDMVDEDSDDTEEDGDDMIEEDSDEKIEEYVKDKVEEILRTIESLIDHSKDCSDTGDDEPPLIMQSFNLPFEGLDIRHERGGNRASVDGDNSENDDEYFEPPKKKFKSATETNSTSATSEDKSSFNNSTCPLSKDANDGQLNESENDKTSGAQISSNNGVMEFDILDEFESNDNDNEENYSSDSSDISLSELDALLDAGLLVGYDATKAANQQLQHEEKQKVILKVKGRDHFDVLPEGWIEVTHNSGMPIYLHKPTRVCSVSKPYFLGPGSTRKHEIPITAIPCLHYLKELEKEKLQQEKKENSEETNEALPSAKLESVKDAKKAGSLDFKAVRDYCMKRFEFQTITVKRFKTWSGRRMHQKMLKQKQRPTLPDSTKLITCPLPPLTDKNSSSAGNSKREFIMNPSGKSPVCILHEYVQHSLREQPKYIFKELENASTPYGAVVIIGNIEYGYGYGSSKKQAKSQAAKAALDVLIPKMKVFGPEEKSEEHQDLEFFDQVRVEDPRVSELSVKAGQPYPYQILLECLKRNYGMGDTGIYFSMRNLKHQKNEFLMTVGKHSVTVICKNKRDGKHRASQSILQLLHPHVNSWGSLLRMYGKGSCKTLKEKKEEEQRITELQSQACANKPNMSILNKLKEEMLKYREKMKTKKPIGKLIPEQMELSTSDSNLKNVEL